MTTGEERFLLDLSKYGGIKYSPYPFQAEFHRSPAPYGFLGGSAGPGKTTCSLLELFIGATLDIQASDGKHIHSLALRRTYPELEATVITRFREIFPPSVYRKFVMSPYPTVTWNNGATLRFGAMQYEADAWSYQGQWKDIYYDELCDFTFKQWMATSAWNRCPLAHIPIRKWGSGNPIGIGAIFVEDLFIKQVPCLEMDHSQRAAYNPEDYPFFGATYLDNPIYANDQAFLKNLEAYPEAFRDALKFGIWGAAGGYFRGVYDEAIHVFEDHRFALESWWKRWLSGNWGYEHPYSYYKHCMDDQGVVYTYAELHGKNKEPEALADEIAEWALENGKMPVFENFTHSFDAAASKRTATMGENPNSVNNRMAASLRKAGIPYPLESTRDKLGRDTLMRGKMREQIWIGEDSVGRPMTVPAWQISDQCKALRRIIPIVKADEKEPEKIEGSTDGTDSPLQGAGYGLYAIFGRPNSKPVEVRRREYYDSLSPKADMTAKSILLKEWDGQNKTRRGSQWSMRQ